MKQQQRCTASFNNTNEIRQFNEGILLQKAFKKSIKQSRIEDEESVIEQEKTFLTEFKRKDDSNNKLSESFLPNFPLQMPSQSLMNYNKNQKKYDFPLFFRQYLSENQSIVSIQQVKKYEQNAFINYYQFRIQEKFEQLTPKIDKPFKKSLSLSKVSRQKLEDENIQKQKDNLREKQIKQGKNCIEIPSIKSFNEELISKQTAHKKIITAKNEFFDLVCHEIPFNMNNIIPTINNLQDLKISGIQTNRLCQQSRNKDRRQQSGKKMLLKQLSSNKFFIDVAMDFNRYSYQLNTEVILEKNRGIQLYIVSPKRSPEGEYFQDVAYFKYQMIKIQSKILQLRVYLLIENDEIQQINLKKPELKRQAFPSKRSLQFEKKWKIWKQIQIPLINQQQRQNEVSLQNKKIKLSIINFNLNLVSVKINNFLNFNLKLAHQEVPVSYYCLAQDFNGVEFVKLSLDGKKKNQLNENLMASRCRSSCKII